MHVIAAKAVAFGEALRPSFGAYAHAVVDNAKALAETLVAEGLAIVSGGTDTHLMLVDLRPMDLTGRDAEKALERAGMTCNKNGIPFDPEAADRHLGHPPGLAGGDDARLRHPGVPPDRPLDRRGAARAARSIRTTIPAVEGRVRGAVGALCERFPIYPQA